jgi:hypothetical protein
MDRMSDIVIEQAVFVRAADGPPELRLRSAGFADIWLSEVATMLIDFGQRPAGIACPAAVFAQPLGEDQVSVIQVADQPGGTLGFHVLVLPRTTYRSGLGNPFAVADRFPPPWAAAGALPTLTMPARPLPPPTVDEVRRVLQRVKAGALREDEDPEMAELTVENAESPALLGGVQVLVDGGKLVFVRPAPDPGLIRSLWTLLPQAARCELWPATFAFGNALGFDAVVVPRRGTEEFPGYTTEEQAADYPAGQYELSLQTAAEAGDQQALDHLFTRRSPREMLRLAVVMALVLSFVVLTLRLWPPPPSPPPDVAPQLTPAQREGAANAAAAAACGDVWTSLALIEFGKYRSAERAATAAGIIASHDPLGAAVQIRAAQARYVEIWKPAAEQ